MFSPLRVSRCLIQVSDMLSINKDSVKIKCFVTLYNLFALIRHMIDHASNFLSLMKLKIRFLEMYCLGTSDSVLRFAHFQKKGIDLQRLVKSVCV